ncbi:MAG: hypothetical protein RLZZ416_50 [Candidatus Parcubacteria bacterium]|jgi:hypothetical protein
MEKGPGDRGKIIPFENAAELEKKARIKRDLDALEKALRIAKEGRGEALSHVPDNEAEILASAIQAVASFRNEVLAQPFTDDTASEAQRMVMIVKVGLSKYLSERQFVEIFGSDLI